MTSPFIHPGLMAQIQPSLYRSRCTILSQQAGQSDMGTPNGAYTAVDGLTDLPCAKGPMLLGKPAMNEIRQTNYTVDNPQYHVTFPAYYPGITEQMHANVDGIEYLIIAVDPDSQKQFTRLQVETVTT